MTERAALGPRLSWASEDETKIGWRNPTRNQLVDIIATVNLPTGAGGRQGPTPIEKFSCMMVMYGMSFDIPLGLGQIGRLSPGKSVEIPISFLDLEHARILRRWEDVPAPRGQNDK